MKLNDIKDLKSFHFIGIGGAGMSALAKILLESGLKVSGSDLIESKTVEDLKKLGAKIFIGHDEKILSARMARRLLRLLSAVPQFLQKILK